MAYKRDHIIAVQTSTQGLSQIGRHGSEGLDCASSRGYKNRAMKQICCSIRQSLVSGVAPFL
jgi:hypothetical protein